MRRLVFALACLLAVVLSPSFAIAATHAPTGLIIPDSAAGTSLTRTADPHGDQLDIYYSYDGAETVTTVFIYRPSYPNAALWFSQANASLATNERLGRIETPNTPRDFKFGNTVANGRRVTLALSGGEFKTTGIAVAQYGPWLVKVRVSSKKLSIAEVDTLIDTVYAALKPRTLAGANPLTLPSACPEALRPSPLEGLIGDEGRALAPKGKEKDALKSAVQAVSAEAMGGPGSLAVAPQNYCLLSGEILPGLPKGLVSQYRTLDPATRGWVMLVGDAGRAIIARPLEGLPKPRGGVFETTAYGAGAAVMTQGMPVPGAALGVSLQTRFSADSGPTSVRHPAPMLPQ